MRKRGFLKGFASLGKVGINRPKAAVPDGRLISYLDPANLMQNIGTPPLSVYAQPCPNLPSDGTYRGWHHQ
jgi:hypothetical protein